VGQRVNLPIDDVLRRLVLLGLPLVPLGCDAGRPIGSAPRDTMNGPTAPSTTDATSPDEVPSNDDAAAGDASFDGSTSSPTPTPGPVPGAGGPFGPMQLCPPVPTKDYRVVLGHVTDKTAWHQCHDTGYCTPVCVEIMSHLPAPDRNGFPSVCRRVDTVDGGVVYDYEVPDGAALGLDVGDAGALGANDLDGARDAGAEDAGDDPTIIVQLGISHCVGGRRPARLATRRPRAGGTAAGRYLARAAALEAASIPAFRQLARELEAHGAPSRLVRAARAAVFEETRHYSLLSRAARARGAATVPIRVRPTPVRSLRAIAEENAREGCVREALGALVAVHQARHAADPSLRAALNLIARDETAHARLAWEIDAWARSVLPLPDVRLVERARRDEGEALVADAAAARTPVALVRDLGLPGPEESRRLTREAHRLLWSA
jgi:hypothetical protein